MGVSLAPFRMSTEAFPVLHALYHEEPSIDPSLSHWVDALVTIKWAVRTHAGAALTAAGRDAYQSMAQNRRMGGDDIA